LFGGDELAEFLGAEFAEGDVESGCLDLQQPVKTRGDVNGDGPLRGFSRSGLKFNRLAGVRIDARCGGAQRHRLRRAPGSSVWSALFGHHGLRFTYVSHTRQRQKGISFENYLATLAAGMGTPEKQLRVTEKANDALKRVATAFPKWSLAQLADSLLIEACNAIMAETHEIRFPTIDYVREQIHPKLPPREDRVLSKVDLLLNQIEQINLRLNEEPELMPPRKRKAG
jgi:hypothetical protein